MKIKELPISARAKVCLLNAGYEEVKDLKDVPDEQLLGIRNLNMKGVAEVRMIINNYFSENESLLNEHFNLTIDKKYLSLVDPIGNSCCTFYKTINEQI